MLSRRIVSGARSGARRFGSETSYDIVVVGGGAGGISTASSILKRKPGLNIAIVEPQTSHYYQPGWTMVGAGIFTREQTARSTASVMPKGVRWIKGSVASFEPDGNQVTLEDGNKLKYDALVAAPGIKLNWEAVEGLAENLGKNGVTSNYSWDHAPYTWELCQGLKSGKAIFTQPPMPIKCAGAPQKALYLSCDYWKRQGTLNNIDVAFHTATPGLFGVKDFVPALMEYMKLYHADLNFQSNLKSIDGANKRATFTVAGADGAPSTEVTRDFDMLHVTPPQVAPDFVRNSPLADKSPGGWVEVDPASLQHVKYKNVFSVGDANSAPNAKTAAAVRTQAPVAAENLVRHLDGKEPSVGYNGYGACPLTVERGKVVLAEFGYGGKLLPTFPSFLLEGTKATRAAYIMKRDMMPRVYFDFVLKGKEWLLKPEQLH